MNAALLAAILAWPSTELARIIAAYRTGKRRDEIKAKKEAGQ